MIAIIDSGGANLVSITEAIVRLGHDVVVTSAIETIDSATHIILPGVGAAQTVMQRLHHLGLVTLLQNTRKPLLGICVGMQVLFEYSQEGATPGLGILHGTVTKLSHSPTRCLPHMGWNTIHITAASPLLQQIPQDAYLYFVHNFAVLQSSHTVAETVYGSPFAAAVHYHNFMGVQFHPERSGAIGTQIVKNFLELGL